MKLNQFVLKIIQRRERSYPLFPLEVVFIAQPQEITWGGHGIKKIEGNEMSYLFELLREDNAVRGCYWSNTFNTQRIIQQNRDKNTFIIPIDSFLGEIENFIFKVREETPHIAFILYGSLRGYKNLCTKNKRFNHYLFIDKNRPIMDQINTALTGCDIWHKRKFEYDIALSFAGEDRKHALRIAKALKQNSIKIFYDEFEKEKIVGTNLYTSLYETYRYKSRYCIIILSSNYINKIWPTHERNAIQERMLTESTNNFLIPIKLEDVSFPGLFSIGYLDIRKDKFNDIIDIIIRKLWVTNQD
jgi:hypothetical protein